MGKRKASQASGAASKKGNGLASQSRDDEPDPDQPTLTAYEQARLDNVARNQQLLGDMRMPQIRGEESAQPRAARTARCEPPRRGRLHPVVTQLCRRIRNAESAPTRQSTRHRATALTPGHSAALNDDSGEPEVFLVPVGYWLRDTPHGASIHCQVENGLKAVGIFVRHSGGDMELDFGPATKLFPTDTAHQWLVRDATEAAAMRLAWAQHRGTQPEPNQGNSDRARRRARQSRRNGLRHNAAQGVARAEMRVAYKLRPAATKGAWCASPSRSSCHFQSSLRRSSRASRRHGSRHISPCFAIG